MQTLTVRYRPGIIEYMDDAIRIMLHEYNHTGSAVLATPPYERDLTFEVPDDEVENAKQRVEVITGVSASYTPGKADLFKFDGDPEGLPFPCVVCEHALKKGKPFCNDCLHGDL